MIQTIDFKTKSEILERKMPRINGNNQYKGKTILAMDGGYSAVKGVSPNKIFSIPSYAKKAPKDFEVVGQLAPTAILYKNNATGELWLVGRMAEALMDQDDVDSTTDASLYTRYRYDSDVYKVIMGAGMAIGLLGTGADNEIYLQTGLPATYKDRDSTRLINALKGDYDISIKVGNSNWADFKFSLDEDHINVIEQPQGTLCATAYSQDGGISKLGIDIMRSNSIIYDIGFGTEDIFSIRSGAKNSHQTYNDTAMRAVFDGVVKELKQYQADYKVFELQNYLESGKVPYVEVDADGIRANEVEFSEILERKNRELCDKSVRRLLQEYGNLIGYKYLIVTGGTGESRFEQIKQMLSGIPNLKVLPGNMNNTDLAFSYSNVIGYYMLRHAKLSAEVKAVENRNA